MGVATPVRATQVNTGAAIRARRLCGATHDHVREAVTVHIARAGQRSTEAATDQRGCAR